MSNELNSIGSWDITIGGVPVVEFTANVGAIGPQGNDGVANAEAPLQYDVMTRVISLDPNYVPDLLLPYDTSITVNSKIQTAIANLVDSAPSTLNTLNEIATALGNDANLATTLTDQIATKADATATTNALATKLPLAGGTMGTNALVVFPTDANGYDSEVGSWGFGVERPSTNKVAYIEPEQIAITTNSVGISLTSSAITFGDGSTQASAFIPSNYLIATDVTNALNLKAPLASPTFTGDPKAPTPATSDNDTSIATTAFVKAQNYLTQVSAGNTYLPLAGGTITGNINAGAYSYGTNGLKYYANGGEDALSLTNLGVNGNNRDGNPWTISAGGASGNNEQGFHWSVNPYNVSGDGWSLNENGISGAGWSISPTGVVGINIPLPSEPTFEKVSVIKNNGTNASNAVIDFNGLNIDTTYIGEFDNYNSSLTFNAVNGLTVYGGSAFTGNTSVGQTLTVGNTNGTDYVRFNPSNNNQIQSNSFNPALLITQTGNGDAFRVQDVSQDNTPFVIDKDGHVGIGISPSSSVCLSVDSTGIKYGSGTTPQTVAYIPSSVAITGGSIGTNVTATTQTAGNNTTRLATTAFVTTADNLKANLASPTFTGTPLAPTAIDGTNTTQIATTAFVQSAVTNLVNASPATLDTLGELATALGNDPNFATTIATQIGTKADATATTNALATKLSITDASTTYYPLGSNPANYATQSYVGSQGYITSSELTPYLTSATASTTYYPLGSNPSGFLTSNSLTGLATESYVGSQGFITSSALTPYAQLSGATFTGKVSINTGTSSSGFNIRTGVTPTTPSIGDMWIGNNNLYFIDNTGSQKTVANTNSSNTWANSNTFAMTTGTNFGINLIQSGNGGGLKITNLGTGESLRVEDETSPDATAFVVSNNGRVGIGVAPDTIVALSVDASGIKVNGATLIPASAVSNPPITSGNMSHSEYLKELVITINGVNYAIPLRVI